MGREEGGGFRMGNTCIPVVDSFWYLAKLYNYVKFKNKIKKKKRKKSESLHTHICAFYTPFLFLFYFLSVLSLSYFHLVRYFEISLGLDSEHLIVASDLASISFEAMNKWLSFFIYKMKIMIVSRSNA